MRTKQELKEAFLQKLTLIDFAQIPEDKQEELLSLLDSWEDGIDKLDKEWLKKHIKAYEKSQKEVTHSSIKDRFITSVLILVLTLFLYSVCNTACFFAVKYYDEETTGELLHQMSQHQLPPHKDMNK